MIIVMMKIQLRYEEERELCSQKERYVAARARG
jgi:hypothetical protein